MSPSWFRAMAEEVGIEVRRRGRAPGVLWASVERVRSRQPHRAVSAGQAQVGGGGLILSGYSLGLMDVLDWDIHQFANLLLGSGNVRLRKKLLIIRCTEGGPLAATTGASFSGGKLSST